MNKVQINKFRMYGAIDLVLDINSSLFTQIAELAAAHQRLKAGLQLIDDNRQGQEANSSGLTESKTELRYKLIWLILQFSSALMAYATAVGNLELKKKAKYVPSELDVIADSIVFDIGTLLFKLAVPIKSELGKYFVGEGEFTAMENLLAGFKSAIPQRRVAKSVSKTSTGNISKVFKMVDKLLREEIDSYMRPFQFTQPDFYNAYKNARLIVGYTGRVKSKDDKTKPSTDPTKS